jgi:S-adenosylmethionine:tRNA ribosyltransferase-isomerase
MQTELFDYHLPPERIAQRPVEPRDAARLLVVERNGDRLDDRHVTDLPDLLEPGDLLVFNDSQVFKARLTARHTDHETRRIELLLLRPEGKYWLAVAKPGKKLRAGESYILSDREQCKLVEKRMDGSVVLDFGMSPDEVFALCDRIGEVPSPPYVEQVKNLSTYQTVYARERGSVAAPTAGFHFTEQLLRRLDEKGVRRAFVTLHVGLGTFRPIKTETLEAHAMHEEWIDVPDETLQVIEKTKASGGRVIAVGTTTVRALESGVHHGFTSFFITPGYDFQKIDALLTNFHLPKSTLLVLVSAFAGRERILAAYQHAIDHGYRFYSFGDAMLII